MPKPLGLPKTGGRKRGTPNRNTQDLMEKMRNLNIDVPNKIVEMLPVLSPEKQVDVLLNLMSFLYPKRKATEQQIEVESHCQSCARTANMSAAELKAEIDRLRQANDLAELYK